jgi:hypothetical protein
MESEVFNSSNGGANVVANLALARKKKVPKRRKLASHLYLAVRPQPMAKIHTEEENEAR